MQTKQKKTFKTKAKRKTYSLKKKSKYTSNAKVSARKKTLTRVRRGGTRSSGRAVPRIYTKNSITQKYNKIADSNNDINNLIDEAHKHLKHSGIVVISMVWPDSMYAKKIKKSNAIHEGHTFFIYIEDRKLFLNDVNGDKLYKSESEISLNYQRLINEVYKRLEEDGKLDSNIPVMFDEVSKEIKKDVKQRTCDHPGEGECVEYANIALNDKGYQ